MGVVGEEILKHKSITHCSSPKPQGAPASANTKSLSVRFQEGESVKERASFGEFMSCLLNTGRCLLSGARKDK